MSEAYHTGGHTRVVERWIEADDKRKYSLVMTRKSPSELPSRLVAAVERSGGRIVELDSETDFIKRGLALRKIAASFETVVLHTHMDDPIPLIAFGSDDFKRPVGF